MVFLLAVAAAALTFGWLVLSAARAGRGSALGGAALGWFVGRLLRVRRAHVLDAMRAAGVAEPSATADAMYRSLGRGLCELLWLAARPAAAVPPLTFVGGAAERAQLSASRGLVIATAHTGNWDLLACAAAADRPLTVVTKRLSIGWLDRLWQQARARRGVRLVEAGGAARCAARALECAEWVAMIVDQAPERARGTISATFLARSARVDLAPALIAARARVPLAAVFACRQPDGTLVAEIAGVIPPPARPSRAWAEQAMRQVTAWLDGFVRAHPEQWLWMHRRWKDAPGAESTAGPASTIAEAERVS